MKIRITDIEDTTLSEVQHDVEQQLLEAYCSRDMDIMRDMLLAGLSEEVGEVLGLRKRQLRGYAKDKGAVDKYLDELGDVFWYLCACCFAFGTDLDEIWEFNKQKLNERGWRHE